MLCTQRKEVNSQQSYTPGMFKVKLASVGHTEKLTPHSFFCIEFTLDRPLEQKLTEKLEIGIPTLKNLLNIGFETKERTFGG